MDMPTYNPDVYLQKPEPEKVIIFDIDIDIFLIYHQP